MHEYSNFPGAFELSRAEFTHQVNLARAITDEIYLSSNALLSLGYSPAQIGALSTIYSSMRAGDACDTQMNAPQQNNKKHYALFQNEHGFISIVFSGDLDFHVHGDVNPGTHSPDTFPRDYFNPDLFYLQHAPNHPYAIDELIQRILRHRDAHTANIATAIATHMPIISSQNAITHAYNGRWLNDKKTDIIVYFPAKKYYMMFRHVADSGEHEIWGTRVNLADRQMEKARQETAILKAQASMTNSV